MIYLKSHPINENKKFDREIEILNDIVEIFNPLEDDWGFEFDYSFIEYEEKRYDSKKYTGTIYNKSGEKVISFGENDIKVISGKVCKKQWFVFGLINNVDKNKIDQIHRGFENSISMAESIFNLNPIEKRIDVQKIRGGIFKQLGVDEDALYNVKILNRVEVRVYFSE